MQGINRAKAWRVAVDAARKLGLDVTKARPHELLLFAKLTSSDNQYTLKLQHDEQQSVISAAEGLLDRDSFIAVGMGLGIVPVTVSGGSEVVPPLPPVFWPDPYVFDEATSGLAENLALESVYWGRHTLVTNEGVRIQKRPNITFRTVQETQGSANSANVQNDWEYKEIGAPVRFGGGDQNEIVIDIKCDDKTNLGGPAARNNYLFIPLIGAIIKGSTTKVYTM